ncbi:IS3 family transposase, partial [bacterium]
AGAPVAAVCRTLKVARSTVYTRRRKTTTRREVETTALDVEVRAAHAESGGTYGSPRVHVALRRKGRRVSRKRVEARMRVLGLVGRRPRRYRRTTEANAEHDKARNLLDRRFEWPSPNQAWVGDITFVWTAQGWAYLAILVDLCTRAIVGWAVSDRCDTELALRALDAAVARHRPRAGLLHHTDRGSTYTSDNYRARLGNLGMVASMSRTGNCWDNAVAESTFATIKAEYLGGLEPRDGAHLAALLFPYIESFYNRRRLHSTLGYITPAEKEQRVAQAKAVA